MRTRLSFAACAAIIAAITVIGLRPWPANASELGKVKDALKKAPGIHAVTTINGKKPIVREAWFAKGKWHYPKGEQPLFFSASKLESGDDTFEITVKTQELQMVKVTDENGQVVEVPLINAEDIISISPNEFISLDQILSLTDGDLKLVPKTDVVDAVEAFEAIDAKDLPNNSIVYTLEVEDGSGAKTNVDVLAPAGLGKVRRLLWVNQKTNLPFKATYERRTAKGKWLEVASTKFDFTKPVPASLLKSVK